EAVAGWTEPSRWRWSSALEAEAMDGGRGKGTGTRLVGEGGFAGVGPGGEPVGADVGGGVGELVDQRGGGLVVEAVKVFVVVGLGQEFGVAVGEEHDFDPGMRGEAGFEGVIGGVGDEGRIVRAQRKE